MKLGTVSFHFLALVPNTGLAELSCSDYVSEQVSDVSTGVVGL